MNDTRENNKLVFDHPITKKNIPELDYITLQILLDAKDSECKDLKKRLRAIMSDLYAIENLNFIEALYEANSLSNRKKIAEKLTQIYINYIYNNKINLGDEMRKNIESIIFNTDEQFQLTDFQIALDEISSLIINPASIQEHMKRAINEYCAEKGIELSKSSHGVGIEPSRTHTKSKAHRNTLRALTEEQESKIDELGHRQLQNPKLTWEKVYSIYKDQYRHTDEFKRDEANSETHKALRNLKESIKALFHTNFFGFFGFYDKASIVRKIIANPDKMKEKYSEKIQAFQSAYDEVNKIFSNHGLMRKLEAEYPSQKFIIDLLKHFSEDLALTLGIPLKEAPEEKETPEMKKYSSDIGW
ncbi:MAG: hypothetical protein SFW66_02500 [Gammaproteobacteria bacterium]|nr:hypothetical protein [Gammaproteobacteria bacterium]